MRWNSFPQRLPLLQTQGRAISLSEMQRAGCAVGALSLHARAGLFSSAEMDSTPMEGRPPAAAVVSCRLVPQCHWGSPQWAGRRSAMPGGLGQHRAWLSRGTSSPMHPNLLERCSRTCSFPPAVRTRDKAGKKNSSFFKGCGVVCSSDLECLA